MKKLIAIFLIITTVLSFTSCSLLDSIFDKSDEDNPLLPTTTDTKESTTKDTQGSDTNVPDDKEEHLYTDFTAIEKKLIYDSLGGYIPFIPNDEYYVEEYSFDYDTEIEAGINFYAFGNTQEEFDAYLDIYSASFEFSDTFEDDYGDTWYCFESELFYVDVSFYYYEGSYVVDVYAYNLYESGSTGGGSTGGSTSGNENVITNEGAGLPTSSDGVYRVDFTRAEHVKNVTDQGYYIDGCPTTGSPAVLVIPVEFSDEKAADKGYTTSALVNAFGKGGETDYYSVYDYYNISSYGQLELDITVLDFWFCPQYDSSYYYEATYEYYDEQVAIGDQLVMDEALAYLEGIMDLSKFDSDNNGIIDAVILINTLDIGEEDFYWAYRYWNIYTDDQGYFYEYDGVSANDYLWASYQFLFESTDSRGNVSYDDTSVMNTFTYIHEFGHVLGLDDYYDTSYVGAPLDGYDIMDSMTGDHNPFSKINLGWITTSRLVVANESITLTLEDFSKNGDTIIIANNWNEALGGYQEYYILIYYTNNELNSGDYGYFSSNGVVVYHVNASLYSEEIDGQVYYDIYNTNTDASDPYYGTEDNLIELVKNGSSYVFGAGAKPSALTDDNGNTLCYTFVVDSVSADSVTLTFSSK